MTARRRGSPRWWRRQTGGGTAVSEAAEWSEGLDHLEEAARARRIADFIAGMTDRFALAEHERLFDTTPELR